MRLTVGPLPPAVYWRRRAIVLGAALLMLFLVAQACMAASASPEDRSTGSPTPDGTPLPTPPTPTPASTGAAAPTTTGGPPPATTATAAPSEEDCTDGEMTVVAEADQTSFSQGTSVQLTIRIRNDADRTCRRDVGSGQRELYLRRGTGATTLWSSRDCTDLTERSVQQLPPGFASEHWTVWNGRGSDDCAGAEAAGELLPAGEYQLVARLGTAYSEPVLLTVSS